ncbi:diguanylate cyclase domain-containing protein [Thauera phenylacetica]|uniref:diguanylate cyclase domain-containing protein n=1 Tax=Thauera phenylacetica TaxID=164400 RepID=UPI0039E5B2A0
MNLRTRFLLLISALILVGSVVAWAVFHHVARQIVMQWGQRVAEIQVRYDRARLLQPLEREIALARQMADSLVLKRWARSPEDPALEAEAVREMENFRRNFSSGNYFVALRASGAYYHNNAEDEFAGRQLRYHLVPAKPADAWFYKLIEVGRDFHLNVNPDAELGVTKLWIDVLIRDGDQTLGVVGTGIELSRFVDEIVDLHQAGVNTLFADLSGAIQLHRDAKLIDFASLVKPEGQKSLVDQLLDREADRIELRETMKHLATSGDGAPRVLDRFVESGGRRILLGIAFVPEIGWYEITLLDLDVLMPVAAFTPVAVGFVLTLLVALILVHLLLRRLILDPLGRLEQAMLRVRDGDLSPAPLPQARGEIGRLTQHFGAMAGAIRAHTAELEAKVRERTDALHRLARIDPLTELTNRRGMTETLEAEITRAGRQGSRFGLLWLDVDHFKEINDRRGHGAGDEALTTLARVLEGCLRPYDRAARWGGDEFLVLLSPCDGATLEAIAHRVRADIEHGSAACGETFTVTVGACLAEPGETLGTVLQRADEALYRAKEAGRNRVVIAPR